MNSIKRLSILFIVLILLLTACGAMSPSSTVRKFYGYMQAEKTEKALTLFSVDIINMLGQKKLLAGLEEGVQQIKAKGGIKSINFEEEKIDGDSAQVRCVIRFGNGEESSESTKLIMENGSWKLAPSK